MRADSSGRRVTMSKAKGWFFDGERRANSRVPLRAPALLDSMAAYQAARCLDVSAGGVLVRADQPLPVGTRLELYFELPPGIPVETEAVVVWAEGRELGLRFLELDPATRAALVAYCELSGIRRIVLQQPAVT
jgi:hypothetical protein